MGNRLNEILEEIRALETSVQEELKCREEMLKYQVRKHKVIFEEEIKEIHKKMSRSLISLLRQISIRLPEHSRILKNN